MQHRAQSLVDEHLDRDPAVGEQRRRHARRDTVGASTAAPLLRSIEVHLAPRRAGRTSCVRGSRMSSGAAVTVDPRRPARPERVGRPGEPRRRGARLEPDRAAGGRLVAAMLCGNADRQQPAIVAGTRRWTCARRRSAADSAEEKKLCSNECRCVSVCLAGASVHRAQPVCAEPTVSHKRRQRRRRHHGERVGTGFDLRPRLTAPLHVEPPAVIAHISTQPPSTARFTPLTAGFRSRNSAALVMSFIVTMRPVGVRSWTRASISRLPSQAGLSPMIPG